MLKIPKALITQVVLWFVFFDHSSFVETRVNLPYVNTGLKSYMICKPNSAAKVGFHLPRKMGGFWVPPLRFLECYYLAYEGTKLRALSLTIKKESVLKKFELSGKTVELEELVCLKKGCLALRIKGAQGLKLVFVVDDTPVWFSKRSADKLKLSLEKGFPTFKEEKHEGLIVFQTKPRLPWKVRQNRVEFSLSKQSVVYVCASPFGKKTVEKELRGLSFEKELKLKRKFFDRRYLKLEPKELGNLVEWLKTNLLWCVHRQEGIGDGVVAGFPDYPWYFGVDTAFSIPGLLFAGFFEEALRSFELLYRFASKNAWRVPHEIVTNGRIYNYGDLEETPLLVCSLWDIYTFTGDERFLKEHLEGATKMMFEHFSKDSLVPEGAGVMEDEQRFSGTKIDVACFGALAYRALSKMHSVFGDSATSKECEKRSEQIQNLVNSHFWDAQKEFYADTLKEGERITNWFWVSVLPLFTKIAPKDIANKVAKTALRKMWSHGLKVEKRKKTVMPVATSLFSIGCFNYSLNELGWMGVLVNLDSFSSFSPACFPEISNSKRGCFLQLWSAATTLQALCHGLLGLEIDQTQKKIALRPWLPQPFERVKFGNMRIGRDLIQLTLTKSGVIFRSKRGIYSIRESF